MHSVLRETSLVSPIGLVCCAKSVAIRISEAPALVTRNFFSLANLVGILSKFAAIRISEASFSYVFGLR